MSERSSYVPGTFSWVDLATSDAAGAQAFYRGLHGWEFASLPMGDAGGTYDMASLGGLAVAALYQSEQPPHWNSFVTVASVDASVERAQQLGGTLVAGPFDVFEAGRSAAIQDPTGAILSLWEARENPGARLVNASGALTWNDLITDDVETAARFYGDLFGWTAEEMPESGGYRVIRNGDRVNGGMLPLRPEMGPVPPNWMPYFGTDDLEAGQARVSELGGAVLAPPMPVPAGGFVVVADPQGAVFALWSGEYDD